MSTPPEYAFFTFRVLIYWYNNYLSLWINVGELTLSTQFLNWRWLQITLISIDCGHVDNSGPFSYSLYKTKYVLISYGCFNIINDWNMTLRKNLVFNENNPSWSMNHTLVSLFWSVDVTVKQYPNDISFDSVIREFAEEMGRVYRQLITSIGSRDDGKIPFGVFNMRLCYFGDNPWYMYIKIKLFATTRKVHSCPVCQMLLDTAVNTFEVAIAWGKTVESSVVNTQM